LIPVKIQPAIEHLEKQGMRASLVTQEWLTDAIRTAIRSRWFGALRHHSYIECSPLAVWAVVGGWEAGRFL